jgi:hypothetical protein
MVCFRYVIVSTLYKGDDEEDVDDNNNNNNNNNNSFSYQNISLGTYRPEPGSTQCLPRALILQSI